MFVRIDVTQEKCKSLLDKEKKLNIPLPDMFSPQNMHLKAKQVLI